MITPDDDPTRGLALATIAGALNRLQVSTDEAELLFEFGVTLRRLGRLMHRRDDLALFVSWTGVRWAVELGGSDDALAEPRVLGSGFDPLLAVALNQAMNEAERVLREAS